jgi:hypothetical protein
MGERRSRLALRAAVLIASLAAGTVPGSAAGFYGRGATELGAELVSADYGRLEQGDDSTVFNAVSADGRYVAIQTRARNFFADDDPDPPGKYRAGGVFRFNLETRELEKVANGDLFNEETNAFLRRGASNPSISADGRFVAFATAEPLVAADTNDNVDVYVRNMSIDDSSPGAFDLVSARDGGDVPATYGPPDIPFPGSNAGADLTRGIAISGDGRYVVFRTEAPSNLPASPSANVAARQLFLRDRELDRTVLLTRTASGGAPAGGAEGGGISLDGSAVAWTGTNAQVQTRFLGGESDDTSLFYYLYRRVAEGPSAPTRRITGVADPDDPACPPGAFTNFDPISTGPCFGPLTEQESLRQNIISQVPALSADGYTVAFVTGSGIRPDAFKGPGVDLFVADMHPGVSRKQGTIQLTRATPTLDPGTSSPIGGIAMSADGGHIAVATVRTQFVFNALAPTGPSRAVPGVRELYVADLAARTLDRVARSYLGEDIDGDVQPGITISGDGSQVAFTSFAGNLFFGDANQRPDAFVATRQPERGTEEEPPPDTQGPAGVIGSDDLTATATPAGRGLVLLTVKVPAAGGVKVVAKARVGKRRRQATVATGTARASGPGEVQVLLRLVPHYRGELRKRKRLRAYAQFSFVASAGGARAENGLPIMFRQRR